MCTLQLRLLLIIPHELLKKMLVVQGVHKAGIRVQARALHLVATKQATNQVRLTKNAIRIRCCAAVTVRDGARIANRTARS